MKTAEIIAGILAGGLFITWVLYLAVRCLGNCRDYKDEKERENDFEHERHINLKK